jgi:TMEM175 potassium channel family protein
MDRQDLSRIGAFSDGVMAVAITLLVLNIEPPTVSNDDLPDALVDLIPSLAAYVLSFALVGRYWVIHHGLFATFVRFDGLLLTLNLAFLSLIVLVPFGTNLVDDYSTVPLAAASFGALLGLAALVHWLMTVHALRAGLVHENLRGQTAPLASTVALGFAIVCFLSVPVAFLSPTVAWLMWASLLVLRYPLRRVARWVER